MNTFPCPTPWRIDHITYETADKRRIRDLFQHEVAHQPYLCRCGGWHLTQNLDEELPTHLTITPADVQRLTTMSASRFRLLVNADVKKTALGRDRIALRDPKLHTRWRSTLKSLLETVQDQLDRNDTAGNWYDRATAYESAIRLRLDECRALYLQALDRAA